MREAIQPIDVTLTCHTPGQIHFEFSWLICALARFLQSSIHTDWLVWMLVKYRYTLHKVLTTVRYRYDMICLWRCFIYPPVTCQQGRNMQEWRRFSHFQMLNYQNRMHDWCTTLWNAYTIIISKCLLKLGHIGMPIFGIFLNAVDLPRVPFICNSCWVHLSGRQCDRRYALIVYEMFWIFVVFSCMSYREVMKLLWHAAALPKHSDDNCSTVGLSITLLQIQLSVLTQKTQFIMGNR